MMNSATTAIKTKSGKVYFTCTCGLQSYAPAKDFTPLTRCYGCIAADGRAKSLESAVSAPKVYSLFLVLLNSEVLATKWD